jgi:tetratricopeptide (TPR) repeat protein
MFSWWQRIKWAYFMNQAHSLWQSGSKTKSVSYAQQALAMAEEFRAETEVINTLDFLGEVYASDRQYIKAESFLLRVLDINKNQSKIDYLQIAANLNSLGQLYIAKSKYAQAEDFQLRALAIYEHQLGDNHLDVAIAINNLAALYELQGRYAEAESLHIRSLKIKEDNLAVNHPDIAIILNNLALVYRSQGKYSEAEKLYLRAIRIREQYPNTDFLKMVHILSNLGRLYLLQARYDESEAFYLRALAIFEDKLDKADPNISSVFNGIASLYEQQGKYEDAESLYLQALKIRQEQLGAKHHDTDVSLNNLAAFYRLIGRYQESELLHLQSLKIREEILGISHPATAMSLSNLAILYRTQGKYREAELLHVRALKIREESLGDHHPDTSTSLINLGRVYEAQEKYRDAEILYLRGLKISEQILGANHPSTAMALNNLAQVYIVQKKFQESESLNLRSMTIRKNLFGENHLDTVMSMHNLASLYSDQKKYELAEELFLHLLEIQKKLQKLGDSYASLNNLALLYKQQGKYVEAESVYNLALKQVRETRGSNHPEVKNLLQNLAAIYLETNRYSCAFPLFVESFNITTNHLKDLFFYSDEYGRLEQGYLKQNSLNLLLSYILTYLPQDTMAIQAAATAVVQWKALATEATITLQKLLYADQYRHLKPKFVQLQDISSQITNLLLSAEKSENIKLLISQLSEKKRQLEKELSSEVPEVKLKNQEIDCFTIIDNLPLKSTLIDFFNFDHYDLITDKYLETIYIALVFSSKKDQSIRLINLGNIKPIDENIQALRNSIRNRNNDFSTLGIGAEIDVPQENRDQELTNQVISPIIDTFSVGEKLIFVPTGHLYSIPFEILPLPNSLELLIDNYQINYLNSARDLLQDNIVISQEYTPPVIITDPDYSLGETQVNLDHKIIFNRHAETLILGNRIANNLAQVKIYQGIQASEIAVKSLVSPRELIMITHGFSISKADHNKLFQLLFQDHQSLSVDSIIKYYHGLVDYIFYEYCKSKFERIMSHSNEVPEKWDELLSKIKEVADYNSSSNSQLLTLQNLENPMLRSGLALAGANLWQQRDRLPDNLGKGVILAEDIAQMNLWNSQLVVLIACSTAMGEINIREGVFGLRRAFALAGAKNLIMSLWDVPVQVTMILMDKFFELYSLNVETSIALQQAQKYVRDITINELEKLETGRDIISQLYNSEKISFVQESSASNQPLKHPYYWSAWICQGRPS